MVKSNQEKYNEHLEWWKKADYKPTKEEVDDLQRLYKVGKYSTKKGK